jgi:hypothetical protein
LSLPRERTRPARCRALCALLLVGAFCLSAPLAGAASGDHQAYIPDALLHAATANPGAAFKVIVQGTGSTASSAVATDVRGESKANPGKAKGLARTFTSISGVSAELTGKQILKLAKKNTIFAITADAPVRLSDAAGAPVNASPPTIAATAQEGQALTAATGDWTGLAPLTHSYQWQRCGDAGRPAAVLGDAPLGYWPLGEFGGTVAADAGGGGLSGTYVGAVTSGVAGVTGGSNAAAGLDGSSAYVDVPGVADTSFASSFTLEAWVKSGAAQQDRGIVGKWTYPWGGLLLWIDGSGNYSLAVTANMANYLTTSVAPTVGTWQHVVGTWDGGMLRLYVDGTEIGSKPFIGVPGIATDNFRIGNYPGPDKYLNGAVDEVALYDHALTPSTIRAHYLGCDDISGATAATYVPTAGDVDSNVRVVVTATNATGASSAASEPTASVVAAPPAPPAVVPPTNSVPPAVTGTPRDGETLTAMEGTWTGTPPLTYSYQWQQCDVGGLTCSDVPAATETTYTLTPTDVGNTLRVLVTAGGANSATSLPTAPILAVPVAPASTEPPTITGTPQEGETLTAAEGTWTGTPPLASSYAWQLCDATGLACSDIAGATAATYALTPNDVGGTIRVVVGTANAAGSTSATSEPTGAVLAAFVPPANTVPPAITGTPRDGETLTAAEGTWTGTAPLTYSYQWQLCDRGELTCDDIPDATAATYTLTASDIGRGVRVVVTAAGAPTGAYSEPTEIVAAAPPVNSSPPVLAAPTEGQAVETMPGAWTGTAPIAYSYAWQRCDVECTNIDGATGSTYLPVAADVGHALRFVVNASNDAGAISATSTTSAPVALGTGYSSAQLWPYASGVAAFWPQAASGELHPPTIAIVDSGIDASRADFGNRVVQQVTLTNRTPNSAGDGRGHGTFVASVAAGELHGHTGAAPNANLVALDVMDDLGMATVSDVIAATDWIYQNKDEYNIRVANFSLTGSVASPIQYDPLDRAVEKLWLSGVVVVAAAGNYADSGNESGVGYAPANDPFVITVGAQDLAGTLGPADDFIAPWSAWGYTPDGFAKPDLSAPGRYIVGAVPTGSTLALERPEQIVEPGYMQLSGTSFSAPVVSGTAADLLGAHPNWTPDQVKGALMLSADPLPLATPRSSGVGAENAARALSVDDPPNPNLALVPYLIPDPSGSSTPVFDAAAWGQVAATDPVWSQAAWGQAAWGQAAWGQAAWGQSYWSSAAWGQGAGSAQGSIVVIAEGDVLGAGGYWINSSELATAQAALGLK